VVSDASCIAPTPFGVQTRACVGDPSCTPADPCDAAAQAACGTNGTCIRDPSNIANAKCNCTASFTGEFCDNMQTQAADATFADFTSGTGTYANSLNVITTREVPTTLANREQYRLAWYFTEMDTEATSSCSLDYVEVSTIDSFAVTTARSRLCGRSNALTEVVPGSSSGTSRRINEIAAPLGTSSIMGFISPEMRVQLRFRTDGSVTGDGFTMRFLLLEPTACPSTSLLTTQCTPNCVRVSSTSTCYVASNGASFAASQPCCGFTLPPSDDDNGGSKIGLFVGIAVGLMVVGALAFFCIRAQRAAAEKRAAQQQGGAQGVAAVAAAAAAGNNNNNPNGMANANAIALNDTSQGWRPQQLNQQPHQWQQPANGQQPQFQPMRMNSNNNAMLPAFNQHVQLAQPMVAQPMQPQQQFQPQPQFQQPMNPSNNMMPPPSYGVPVQQQPVYATGPTPPMIYGAGTTTPAAPGGVVVGQQPAQPFSVAPPMYTDDSD
jgi:hypothetical protein